MSMSRKLEYYCNIDDYIYMQLKKNSLQFDNQLLVDSYKITYQILVK